jgi:hypothetical protein
MENSYQREVNYTMEVFERPDHFLVVCTYENRTDAFVVYLTAEGKLVNLKN